MNLFILATTVVENTSPEMTTEVFRIPVYMVTEQPQVYIENSQEVQTKTNSVALENPDDSSKGAGHLIFVLGKKETINYYW